MAINPVSFQPPRFQWIAMPIVYVSQPPLPVSANDQEYTSRLVQGFLNENRRGIWPSVRRFFNLATPLELKDGVGFFNQEIASGGGRVGSSHTRMSVGFRYPPVLEAKVRSAIENGQVTVNPAGTAMYFYV